MGTEIDQVMQSIADIKAFVGDKVAAGLRPVEDEMKRMVKDLTAVQNELREAKREAAARLLQDARIRVGSGRLAGFTAFDLALTESLLRLKMRTEGRDDRNWYRPVDDGGTKLGPILVEARKELRARITFENVADWLEQSSKAARSKMGPNAGYDALTRFERNMAGFQSEVRGMIVKAMDSTTAAAGDELVPTFESAEMFRDVNLATNVLPALRQIPMPTTPYDLPQDFGDTNWYPSSENIQVTTTDVSTGKNTLTAYGLKTGVPFSDELTEDAIVAFVPELRASLVRNAAEIIDNVLLNADTTATNNINADGVTISSSTAGKAHWLLGFDGLIHLPLVDNTGQRNDRNGAIDASAVYNRALTLLGRYAAPQVRGDVVFFSDVRTAIRSLVMSEVITLEKYGARATIVSGELGSVFGTPLIMSEQMVLADTDGLVTDAGNVTSTGRVLAVNTTQWRVGFRRGITVEPDREPGKGQTTIYVSLRIALVPRGTRSTATHTSLVYDITGV